MFDSEVSRRRILRAAVMLFATGCNSRTNTSDAPVSQTKEMPLRTVSDAWQRIHNWLESNAPKIMANLNPPATELELTEAEKSLNQAMPREWHEVYGTHNGMNSTANLGSLFFGMQFLPLDAVLREYELSNVSGHDPIPVRAADSGVRTEDIHNPKWIAFAHDGGETLLRVDMAPGDSGKIGQVIFTDHADNTVIQLAESLTDFMSQFADDLESGQYSLDKQALEDGDQFLACDPKIDVVNWHRTDRWKHLAR